MRRRILTCLLCLAACLNAGAQYRTSYGSLEDSDAVAAMKRHVEYLASPAREGRKAGSEGELEAAVYVAEELVSCGVEVLGGPEGDLFGLKQALAARGIDLLDASAPETCGIQDCEFLDGLHMGEVASCRLLREFANARPELLAYVDMERVSRTLNEWPGHAFVRDERIDPGFETDFLGLGCRKRTP